MVCQRGAPSSSARKGATKGQEAASGHRLPAKKRRVQPQQLLTKESLDAHQQTKGAAAGAEHHVATVSEDSMSNDSSSSSSSDHLRTMFPRGGGGVITSDRALAQRALKIRNEEERMRVARAMLYDAYQKAIRGEL